MPKKILITGATGLIGRQVVQTAVTQGDDVVGLDRSLDSRLDIIPPHIRSAAAWVEADTRDAARLQAAMTSVDTVIHLAAGASFLMYEEAPLEQTAGTIQGFHTVLEAVRQAGVRRLVYASTSAVYEGNKVPYRESMRLDPPDLKAFSKKVNEEMAAIYARRYGIQVIGLRPFSVYGDQESHKGRYANVVSLFSWAMYNGRRPIVWGDGSQTRDFIHASDVSRAFVLAAHSDTTEQHLNVGTGIETTFLGLIKIIAGQLGIEASPVFTKIPVAIYAQRLLADVSLTRATLGFTHQVALDKGVQRVLTAASRLRGTADEARLERAHYQASRWGRRTA